ncbi:hypothetical protein EPD60_05035 [Flaviaesturariibacter flavus]|uniref:Uncharacterized protein n=1 Tax=Flaviaesturariibacter flavus TaxID=2502780 RepID=A0A4R1BJU5_9BACT|nr:hypothetical protein [Flaviaesturariibacter flavus]TCJ17559.1 hypothetical protein EPD60_05035 [Flaviaesturariibacter flavus]
MDLNHIQLRDTQLVGLYGKTLVELPSANAAPPPEEAPPARTAAPEPASPPPFLGQHGKGILMVNEDPENVFIADADLEVLTKIMDRAGTGLAEIAIVNWARLGHTDGPALVSGLNSSRVLLFGVTPERFGLPAVFPHFQVQKLAGRSYLCAPPVAELATADASVKKNFWNAFQAWLA